MEKLDINNLEINPFNKIGKEWMLVTSKKDDKVNAMTASWGGLGVLWNKNIAFIVLRPQRYTKEFIDSSNEFSLSSFDSSFKKTLGYFGSVSGREEDKISKSGLHLIDIDGIPSFDEANFIITCKNLYKQDLIPEGFIDSKLDSLNYPNKDYHTLYLAEITGIYKK